MSDPAALPYTLLSDAARRFLRRKKIFRLIDSELLEYAAVHRSFCPLGYCSLLSDNPLSENHKQRTVYLVKGQLKGTSFYKIGLTLHSDPLKRDRLVYKEVVRAHSVPLNHADTYESYCLWRCLQTERRLPYDDSIFGGWAGQGEVINSMDNAVVEIFDQSFHSLSEAICKYGYEETILELISLNIAVYAIYDEWYLYSGHAIAAYASLIENECGRNSAEVASEIVSVGLSPQEKRFLVRRLVANLAPIVDRKWDELGIRDPSVRYEVAKARIAANRASKWGNRDTTGWRLYRERFRSYESNEQYALLHRSQLVDFDRNHGKVFK